jgi:hypothetical protein
MSNIVEKFGKYGIREVCLDQHYISANDYRYEQLLTVKINQRSFEELIVKAEKCEEWNKTYYEDMFVREKVPAVKQAYEKYQMFLELARTELK